MKKAIINTGTLTLEAEGNTQVELFDAIAEIQEVFAEPNCGRCGCTKLRFQKRTVNGDDYHELCCTNPECGARLNIGMSKANKGALFPIRKVVMKGPDAGKPSRKDGQYDAKYRGWSLYHKKFGGKADFVSEEQGDV